MATRIWTGATDGTFSTAGNWSGGVAPVNSDTVYLEGSVSITAGLNTGLTGINLYVDDAYTGAIGSSSLGYLQITCATFVHAGLGTAYVDLLTSAINAQVTATASGNAQTPGLLLKGSALTGLTCSGGSTGLAGMNESETSAVTTVRIAGQSTLLLLGVGVTTPTTISLSQGTLWQYCGATTINMNSGTLKTWGAGAVGTINQYGGTAYPNSSGTITTYNLNGGTADFTTHPLARTVSTLKHNPGATLKYDPAYLTITTRSAPDYAISMTSNVLT